MGRGLSDSQKWILMEAGKRPRLYYADIMFHYRKFPLKKGSYPWENSEMKYTRDTEVINQFGSHDTEPWPWEKV